MQLGIEGVFNNIPEKRNIVRNVSLTERDFEILEFIMDMKFSGIYEVFEKFFRITQLNEIAKSTDWAKKRLFQLEKAKFLKSVKSFSEATRYYTTTFKAYYAIANFKPEVTVTKPNGGFDQRTFNHDRMVLRSRLLMESQGLVTSWLSDRKLRSSSELSGGLTSLYIPDAIYKLPSGEKVAFELEIAVKGKSRYQDKIKKYVHLMRARDVQHKIFDRVHYVCAKVSVAEHLEKETRIYGDLFKIERLDTFFALANQLKTTKI